MFIDRDHKCHYMQEAYASRIFIDRLRLPTTSTVMVYSNFYMYKLSIGLYTYHLKLAHDSTGDFHSKAAGSDCVLTSDCVSKIHMEKYMCV